MKHFILGSGLRSQIEAQARASFPRECCGLIEGLRRDHTVEARALHATRNLAAEADRYEIDPAEHIRLLREVRAAGRQIVGCYHSHPNGLPDLSARDREHADEEGFVWLIASLLAPDTPVVLRGFIVANGNFERLTLGSVGATG